jgi:hypothetical protein
LEKQNRVLHNRWEEYTGGTVVFRPARMSVEKLEEMYEYAWNTFYKDFTKEVKMGRLFMKVIEREQADGTYRPMRLARTRKWTAPAAGGGA